MKVPFKGSDFKDGRYERKGHYSVKTGYWEAVNKNCKEKQTPTSESSCQEEKIWNKLWSLNIPPKVKVFTWKGAHEIIVAEANLMMHHVPVNPRCVLCGYYWANSSHVLFFCQAIKKA